MRGPSRLSESETGKVWLAQFRSEDDAKAATKLLDAMLLLNDTDVADAIRDGINMVWPRALARAVRRARV
jgi:hypothetical protein